MAVDCWRSSPYYCARPPWKKRTGKTHRERLAMIFYPHIDPVILRLGPLQFRWYGLMYVLSLTIAYFLIKAQAAHRGIQIAKDQLYDLIVYAAIGVFAGGRLGYTLFYNFRYYYTEHPEKI